MRILFVLATLLSVTLAIRAVPASLELSDDFWKELRAAGRIGRGGGGNVVVGNGNVVTGNHNSVEGDSNKLNGNSNNMRGNSNIHLGDVSAIEGDDNWTEGNGLTVRKNGERILGANFNTFLARRPSFWAITS